jgi:ribonuclease E
VRGCRSDLRADERELANHGADELDARLHRVAIADRTAGRKSPMPEQQDQNQPDLEEKMPETQDSNLGDEQDEERDTMGSTVNQAEIDEDLDEDDIDDDLDDDDDDLDDDEAEQDPGRQ